MSDETKLQRVFREHSLVQSAIAREADVSQGYLSLILALERTPSMTVARRLLAVLRGFEPSLTLEDFLPPVTPTGTEG